MLDIVAFIKVVENIKKKSELALNGQGKSIKIEYITNLIFKKL